MWISSNFSQVNLKLTVALFQPSLEKLTTSSILKLTLSLEIPGGRNSLENLNTKLSRYTYLLDPREGLNSAWDHL